MLIQGYLSVFFFFFSSRRRHTRCSRDWSSDVCSSDLEDGAGALTGFTSFRPDVVLLDLMLPDMTGVEVCRELRRTSETPIIVLSAIGDRSEERRVGKEGRARWSPAHEKKK